MDIKNYNRSQNIWHKAKIEQKVFKNVISNSACFLTAIVNVLISGRKTGH